MKSTKSPGLTLNWVVVLGSCFCFSWIWRICWHQIALETSAGCHQTGASPSPWGGPNSIKFQDALLSFSDPPADHNMNSAQQPHCINSKSLNWFCICCSLFLEHRSLTSSELRDLRPLGCSSGTMPLRGLWLTVLCSFLVISPFLITFKCSCFSSVSSFRVGAMLFKSLGPGIWPAL